MVFKRRERGDYKGTGEARDVDRRLGSRWGSWGTFGKLANDQGKEDNSKETMTDQRIFITGIEEFCIKIVPLSSPSRDCLCVT